MTTVALTSSNIENSKQAKQAKQQETVKRVQKEFFCQLMQGKSEKEAFKQALKAMDEKYKPEKDTMELSYSNKNGHAAACVKFSPETIKPWIELIAIAIPVLTELKDLFCPSKTPKEEEAQELQMPELTA